MGLLPTHNISSIRNVHRGRVTRSLLPFIGKLSKGIFGTDTEPGVEVLRKHINQLVENEQSQSWGFMSRSTARVILGQVLRFITCGSPTHTEVTACD